MKTEMATNAPIAEELQPAYRGDRLLRIRDVEAKTGLGSSTIYRRVAAGSFPAPVKLGEGCTRWRESDLDRWIAGLPAG